MSANALLNLLNKLKKEIKYEHLFLFRNKL